MNNYKSPITRQGSHHKQKGIATVLMVVLVGLALTATAFGITHSIRSTQEKHVAVNAITHAQTGAWAAAEAVRRYLTTLDEDAILALNGNLPFQMGVDQAYGAISVNVTGITDEGGGKYHVYIDIVNKHDAAKSSAGLGMVYEVTAASPPPTAGQEMNIALNFYDDLDTGGSITFVAPDATLSTSINIEGDFTAESVGLNNVGTLQVTGSVTIGDGTDVETIKSNDDVTLKTGASAATIESGGDVHVENSTSVGTIKANGNVIVDISGTPVTSIQSRSNVTITDGTHGTVSAGGDVNLGGAAVASIEAIGNIDVFATRSFSASTTGEGNLTCILGENQWNLNLGAVSLNGTSGAGCNQASLLENQSNSITIMDELEPIVIPPINIDVWQLKQYAHYAFEYDAVAGEPKVTVKNIQGIPDGEYSLADYGDNRRSYICKTVNESSGKCDAPAFSDAYIPVCLGSGAWTGAPCLSYDVDSETWFFSEVDDGNKSISNAAPGIMWFEGNLSVNMGYSYTTLFATGNFIAQGNFYGASVNYGDANEICLAQGNNIYRSEYYSRYEGFYPTDMCDALGNFTPMPAGNVAVAAGGYNPEDGGAYSGGNVTFQNTSRVWGTVLAGSYLSTGNSTEIYGYVTAAALSGKGSGANSLDHSTLIDLSYFTDNFNPTLVPGMPTEPQGDDDGGGGDGGGGAAEAQAKVLWSRHL